MPIIKSAKKRVKTANKAAIRNSKAKRTMREAVKSLNAALENDTKKAAAAFKEAQSAIDTAVKKNLMHKNKAARTKAALSQKMKDAGIKLAASKTAKPATEKAPAKKPAAKKAPAKKPAAKKTTK